MVLPDILRALPASKIDSRKGGDFRHLFDHVNLLAAYPFLLLVYIMKYKRDPRWPISQDVTVVLQAHDDDGDLSYDADEPKPMKPSLIIAILWSVLFAGSECVWTSLRKPGRARFAYASQVSRIGMLNTPARRFNRWMDGLLDAPGAVASATQRSAVAMDDPRVRVLDQGELNRNRQWIKRGLELVVVTKTLKARFSLFKVI